jgi:DNA helicase INO80
VFSPQHVHRSVFPPEADSLGSVLPVKSGTFSFSRMIDMSPGEVDFFAKASDMERFFFSFMAQDWKILNEIIDVFMESKENRFQYDWMGEGEFRALTRNLMLQTCAKLILLKTKHATRPENAPYE